MNTIQDSTSLESLNTSLNTNSKSSSQGLGQEQFLQLMIAQLKNQDPTKPLDGQEYLGQLAQFSTVNGIQGLQQSLTQLSQSLQASQASSLVGHTVMIDSNKAYLAADKPLQGSVNLTDSVKNLTISVSDSSGREIQHLTLGDQAAGNVNFSWDGKDSSGNQSAAGIYQVKAEGTVNGKLQSVDTQLQATVQSISLGQGGQSMTLNLVGLGGIDISKLREVL